MTVASENRPEEGAFDSSIVPVRRPTDLHLDDDGQVAMYDPEGARLVVLNESAAAFWTECDGVHDLGAIVDRLGRRFSAVPGDIVLDVWATFLHLAELGLVEGAPALISGVSTDPIDP